MQLRHRIADTWETNSTDVLRPSSYCFRVELLGPLGEVLDADVFRFAKQTKYVLLNPPPDPANPPPGWTPQLRGPLPCNIPDYGILADIAARHFLRRQGLIQKGQAWGPAALQTTGTALPVVDYDNPLSLDVAQRNLLMVGAMLEVDAPDVVGMLRKLPPSVGTVLTISTDFDGNWNTNEDCNTTGGTQVFVSKLGVGAGHRTYIRYPLSSLPANPTVSNVDFKIRITYVSGSPLVDLQAYNQNGQADPEADACTTRGARCADDPTPYLDDNNSFQTTGIKTITLPSAANTDIGNAKAAVNRFSLGANEDSTIAADDETDFEALENAGTDEPKLVITYTAATPAELTLQSVAGIAAVSNVEVGTPRVTLQSVAGIASLSNLEVATPAGMTLQGVAGIAALSNVEVGTPRVTLQSIAGVASLSNVEVATPAPLSLDAVAGIAAVSNVEVGTPRVTLQSVAGIGALPNLEIATPAGMTLQGVAGIAALPNVEVSVPAWLTLGAVAGIGNLPNLEMVTPTVVVLQATAGLAVLPNVEVGTPRVTLQTVAGVASLLNVDLQSPEILPKGGLGFTPMRGRKRLPKTRWQLWVARRRRVRKQ